MLDLSVDHISGLNLTQVEHNLLYVRYLLKREKDDDRIKQYIKYLELLNREKVLLLEKGDSPNFYIDI